MVKKNSNNNHEIKYSFKLNEILFQLINKHKGIISVQNLYKDLKEDSVNYVNTIKSRNFQVIIIHKNSINHSKQTRSERKMGKT